MPIVRGSSTQSCAFPSQVKNKWPGKLNATGNSTLLDVVVGGVILEAGEGAGLSVVIGEVIHSVVVGEVVHSVAVGEVAPSVGVGEVAPPVAVGVIEGVVNQITEEEGEGRGSGRVGKIEGGRRDVK